jgi:serine/threonine-protein kinase RsbW
LDVKFFFGILYRITHGLEKIEEKTKYLFITIAILLYTVSLVQLAQKVSPLTSLDEFLVKALANLSIPFGVILLQEFFELINTIPKSALQSACQQFELIALVILRSFFKEFYKLNKAVTAGEFSDPVKLAIVKVVSLAVITVLIIIFKRLSERAGLERQSAKQVRINHLKQFSVIILCLASLVYMLYFKQSFYIITFLSIVFTGLIVLDALFFMIMIPQNDEFDNLMYDGTLVISLIFARFPLFAVNIVAFPMAMIGVALATGGLYLFIRPTELHFLGNPREDEVARLDIVIKNRLAELETVNKKTGLFLKQFNVADDKMKKVRLACEELLSNIITFAYTDKQEHAINIGLALCGKRLTVTISDFGKPFNPFRQDVPDTEASLEEREIGGLGIYLVRSVMNKVAYNRQTGKNVTTLLMVLDDK